MFVFIWKLILNTLISCHKLKKKLQEIYLFICQINVKQNKGEKMKNNKINKYLFGLGAFALVFYLVINTNEQNTKIISNQKESKIEEYNLNQIKNDDFSITEEKLKELTSLPTTQNETFESNDTNNKYLDEIEDEKSIFINSIKISKQIDLDEMSDTFREPINAYKTITTLDKSVTKEIDYYPLFYIWTSINTENMDLNKTIELGDNEQSENLNELNPPKLSMIVRCNGNIINEFDYQINAKTPRWREWVEIDLTQFKTEVIMGQWNIQIINNNEILETRNFTFKKDLDIDEIKQTAEIIN
tara:strand:- start:290 stop:1192 length:903 start_codon:yes stop_codon:yes gene_type:complete